MDKKGFQKLMRGLVEANPDVLHNPDSYFKHVNQTYDLAQDVVQSVLSKYPNIPIIAEEVSLAAGLHDIGRPLKKDQTFHELRGAKYIEREGLENGFAASLKDTYRIAQMLRSHGFVYESWLDPECLDSRSDFEPLETSLLIPRTWQEAIVTYSDLAGLNGERVSVEDRLVEVLQRYENDPKYQDGLVVRVTKAASNRLLELAERVEALEQGRLSEQDIVRYGFL